MKRSFFVFLLTWTIYICPAQTSKSDSVPVSSDTAQGVRVLKNKLLITGWIQAQFQYAESRGVSNFDGGDFAPNSDKRFMIRRGRIKFTYTGKNTQYVMQINGTERGLNLVELYGVVTDPWTKMISLTAGVMNRPFGFEIDQSSAVRESPERSRYSQHLMPNERDMGAKLSFVPTSRSPLYGFRIDAGFYNGQGIYVPPTFSPPGYAAGTTPMLGVNEFDSQKDFIGRICYYKNSSSGKIRFGVGGSHYNGGNMYQNNRVYNKIIVDQSGNKNWLMADTLAKSYVNITAPRIYYGAEGFFSVKTGLGLTTLRGEVISGTQSGSSFTSVSPFYISTRSDTYVRDFHGMYAFLIHRISKHELFVKYEYYDPNTSIQGKDILGEETLFTGADVRFDQLGFGYNYHMDENIKFLVYFNVITNETTGNGLAGLLKFTNDIKDNILTVRMQYRF